MSWYSKVAWSEGLFLRQHHFQQNDRYFERLLENRVRQLGAYPWGFSQIEIDRDLAQQNKFALRRASGVFQDGTPFDMPGSSPLPAADRRAGRGRQADRLAGAAGRGRQRPRGGHGRGHIRQPLHRAIIETIIDSSSGMHVEQEIEVAHPRATFEIRKTREARRALPARRPHSRSARQDDRLRRDLRAAGHGHATRIRSSPAGSSASSAGWIPSSKRCRATPPIRVPVAACRPSTISCCRC